MKRMLHLSDPHFGAVNSAAAKSFLESAASLRPDLTLLSGDLTMRARWGELAAAREFVSGLPEPRLVIAGNHDIPLINQPFDRFFRSFRRYQTTFGHDLEPEWTADGIHVVCLNSNRAFGFHADWSEGRLSGAQLEAMKVKFSNSPNGSLRVLMLHHPLIEPSPRAREVVKPLGKLIDALEASKVDLVLCGHFHRSVIQTLEAPGGWRTVISQAPTVCSIRLQGEPQGFHEIIVDGQCLKITRHRYSGDSFSPDFSQHFRRGASGWDDEFEMPSPIDGT